jgi:cytochrome c oxidase subunit 6a
LETTAKNVRQTRNMSAGASIEEEIAEMNKWRAVSFLAIPACAGFGVYTFANVHHSHNEHPSYSYLKIRNREQFPWGGDCGLFEYRDDCK